MLTYKKDTGTNKTCKYIFELLRTSEDTERIAMVPSPELDPETLQRMCEVLYLRRGAGSVTIQTKAVTWAPRKKKGREDEGIVIESDGEKGLGYADILKKIKTGILDRDTLDNM